ncbi:MAG: tRNA 4-thiouridine(8) synthase ThiI [Treponema sp.]|uniref:tRNA uracil 4-sulfurtransferase ThiI n=1 Tax=Treponema sp. TaxID=166 RepID=UPI00298E7D11|nr:tRNA uracil 4-sulfurtransferase ThiI [Treponema sp.]MBR5933097.1 tRNA 4-thiouridine(8) synthase ThiI [Treponema sp.]
MKITYLAKLGELVLKGSNKNAFESKLVRNVREFLKHIPVDIILRAGRMYVEVEEENCPQVEFCLSHLIGITGWAKTFICEKNIESITDMVTDLGKAAKENGAKTFKIDARRSDKSFELDSYEIMRKAASGLYDNKILDVDLHNPDVTIWVEVREKCFVYTDSKTGCRGLPVGMSGKGLLLLSGGLDSPVAGYRMLRRGMRIECIYFHSYPYTSDEAQKKVEDLAKILSTYGMQTALNIVSFTDVQMLIKEKAPESWSTLALRMCMMKAANMVAKHIGAQCLITGESLGQVASQTLENMQVTESCAELPLLRPLVGLDKEEIIDTAEFIGTYDTSILPYEDCCVLFSPRHPVLKATLEEAQEIYNKINPDELIKKAFETRVVKHFYAFESL